MEENKEEYRLCAHCKKDVAAGNFVLHESHCRRFLSLCPDCGEPVPRDEMEQHRSEQHTQVRCTQCKKKLERCRLQDHQENECEDRLQCCQFCQLQLPFRSLAEHISACGSRTELCPDCNRYVKLQDMDAHSTSCSTRPQGGIPSKVTSQNAAGAAKTNQKSQFQRCFKCMESVSVAQMQKHQLECLASSPPSETEDAEDPDLYQITSFSLQGRKTSKEKDMGEISTCPLCHLALPQVTLQRHEYKCRLFENLRKSVAN
ncbi:XIAP-associated factor 1 [Paramormyrops kingsleyae]|uniref:XIAP-associated factor 1 n=1 Tax=Paramormyrops kingsleyae TaxID=1676925 RepID=UPI003B975753